MSNRNGAPPPEAAATENEEQMILRVPLHIAEELRQMIRGASKGKKKQFDKRVAFAFDTTPTGTATFAFGDKKYQASLVNLPCVTESLKTNDSSNYYKSADIGQMLMVHDVEKGKAPTKRAKTDEKGTLPSGIVPAFRNIQKMWRKPYPNKKELQEVEAEYIRVKGGTVDNLEEIEEVEAEEVDGELREVEIAPEPEEKSKRKHKPRAKKEKKDSTTDEEGTKKTKRKRKEKKEKREKKERKTKRRRKSKGEDTNAAKPKEETRTTALPAATSNELDELEMSLMSELEEGMKTPKVEEIEPTITSPHPQPTTITSPSVPARSPVPSPLPPTAAISTPPLPAPSTPTPPPLQTTTIPLEPVSVRTSLPSPLSTIPKTPPVATPPTTPQPASSSLEKAPSPSLLPVEPTPPMPSPMVASPPSTTTTTTITASTPVAATPILDAPSSPTDARYLELKANRGRLLAEVETLNVNIKNRRTNIQTASNPIVKSRFEKQVQRMEEQLKAKESSLQAVEEELANLKQAT